jgi:hypothetical protein
VESPGLGSTTAGAGGPAAAISGGPSELLLFLSGRQAVADVQVTGPDDVVAKLKKARFGV